MSRCARRVALVAMVLAGGAAASCTSNGSSGSSTASATCAVTGVADGSLPSVVTVMAGNSNGSGSIIRSNGYILTNDHVVTPAVSGGSLSVQFDNGGTAAATIVGR
ncbi:MAG TPA: trypsin-like peptidase domain-containing protein, partial [Chloroflexota bacterium]